MPLCSRRIRAVEELILAVTKGISRVQLSHAAPLRSARFDDPSLVSAGGLVPVVALADRVGLRRLVDEQLTVPTDKGAHAGSKVAALVAGMVAGADSIEDMNLLRHGGMTRLFSGTFAPSTLGSFLRSFTFGHVRQLDAVAACLVTNLASHTPLLPDAPHIAYLDVDDTIRATHGYADPCRLGVAGVLKPQAGRDPRQWAAQGLRGGQVLGRNSLQRCLVKHDATFFGIDLPPAGGTAADAGERARWHHTVIGVLPRCPARGSESAGAASRETLDEPSGSGPLVVARVPD